MVTRINRSSNGLGDKFSELSSWAHRPSQAIPNSIIIRRRTKTVLTRFTVNFKKVLRVQKF